MAESMTDQWLSNGDCTKCRRQKYCTKDCTAAKRYSSMRLSALTATLMTECMRKMTDSGTE